VPFSFALISRLRPNGGGGVGASFQQSSVNRHPTQAETHRLMWSSCGTRKTVSPRCQQSELCESLNPTPFTTLSGRCVGIVRARGTPAALCCLQNSPRMLSAPIPRYAVSPLFLVSFSVSHFSLPCFFPWKFLHIVSLSTRGNNTLPNNFYCFQSGRRWDGPKKPPRRRKRRRVHVAAPSAERRSKAHRAA